MKRAGLSTIRFDVRLDNGVTLLDLSYHRAQSIRRVVGRGEPVRRAVGHDVAPRSCEVMAVLRGR
jgi:hypothetical protein